MCILHSPLGRSYLNSKTNNVLASLLYMREIGPSQSAVQLFNINWRDVQTSYQFIALNIYMFLAKYKKAFTREQEISKRAHKEHSWTSTTLCTIQYIYIQIQRPTKRGKRTIMLLNWKPRYNKCMHNLALKYITV